jgi:N4-gp56 family major capsid protein
MAAEMNNVYGGAAGVDTATTFGNANTVTHYYDRAGIKAANAVNVYGQFADRKSQPTKMGKTFKISKYLHIYDLDQDDATFAAKGYLGKRDLATVTANLAATDGSGAGLTEGAGAINQVSVKKVTVSTDIARYGYMIEYTDEAVLFSEDPVQVKYREELGYLMNQTNEDLVQKDMLNGAGIEIQAGGVNKLSLGNAIDGTDATTIEATEPLAKISFDLVRSGIKALVRNRAKRNTEIVTGSTKIGTAPINKAFYGIVGPEVKYDLESLTRGSTYSTEYVYVPAYQYAAASNLAEGEIGSMHDVRFIESEGAMMEAGAGFAVPDAYDTNGGTLSTSTVTSGIVVVDGGASGGTIIVDGVTYTLGASETLNIPASAVTSGITGTVTEGAATDGDLFDVFPILFPTQGAFATLGLRGKGKTQFHSKAPSDVNLTNPYGTKGFFSANMFYAGLVLQPEKLLRINVLATA